MQVVWHDSFHLRENPRPGERLAREQLVQKLGLIGDIAVLRSIQNGSRLRLLLVEAVNLLPDLRQLPVDAAGVYPLINDVANQHYSNEGERRHDRAHAPAKLPRGFVRLAGKIDVESHQDTSAPTTPARTERGTLTAAAPAMLLEISSSTRMLEVALNATCSS